MKANGSVLRASNRFRGSKVPPTYRTASTGLLGPIIGTGSQYHGLTESEPRHPRHPEGHP